MMIEERLEDTGRQIAMGVGRAGGGLMLRVGERSIGWFLRFGGRRLDAMRGVIRRGRDTGRMSERRLQRVAGGDIHAIELEREQVRKVVASLKKAGVRYSVERRRDTSWIHFEGRDLDHVTHAVRRALDDVGYELRVDGPQHERTRSQAEAPEGEQTIRPLTVQHHSSPGRPDAGAPARGASVMPAESESHEQPKPLTFSGKAAVPRKPRKTTKAETLRDLRERIGRKLKSRPERVPAARKPDRSRGR